MSNVLIKERIDLVTVDGTTNGYIGIADNTGYYPGITVTLYSPVAGSMECIVTEIDAGGHLIGLRRKPQTAAEGSGPQYGRTDVSAFQKDHVCSVNVERQLATVERTYQKMPIY